MLNFNILKAACVELILKHLYSLREVKVSEDFNCK